MPDLNCVVFGVYQLNKVVVNTIDGFFAKFESENLLLLIC